jgi:hypothetical protein
MQKKKKKIKKGASAPVEIFFWSLTFWFGPSLYLYGNFQPSRHLWNKKKYFKILFKNFRVITDDFTDSDFIIELFLTPEFGW